MKAPYLLLIIVLLPGTLSAQESEEPAFGIKFSGFVKTDLFWDTRQVVTARDGHFLLWPAGPEYDAEGKDINEKPSFNFLSIQTRLHGKITGPDVLGAQTSGAVEGAFFGHSNGDINGFRLRHAFVRLNWPGTELMVGQYWHPMFVTACFPGVVSFNTGVPFQPFSRNPQVRLTRSMGNWSIAAVAFSQLDFQSSAGAQALRNAALPELHLQLNYHGKNETSNTEFLAGAGAGFKTLVPRLVSDSNYVDREPVSSFMAEFHTKIKLPKLTIKGMAHYGQNSYDILMLSSFAVTEVDPANDLRAYTPLTSMASWLEIHSNHPVWQPGLFAGYTRNMGAGEDIFPSLVDGTRGNIDYIWRLSPRLIYNVEKFRVALELEYTTSAFGDISNSGKVENSEEVSNFRTLIGVYYFF